ncbi:MAG: glycerol-3-phosphate 1-O-acyltransferase PlsY [candidate division Zixibacteria bacterium]|nr:glycerol-3-phosphate 1-O-acyltransferase PlsY [candidate division Zixibacteria bacterium]
MIEKIILAVLTGYLLGGLPFGVWISRMFGKADIRSEGSGNIGATNVWRVAGKTAGVATLVLDIAKGSVAVVLAEMIVSGGESHSLIKLCGGSAAVLGHMFSPLLGFKGGKGVNTALGVFVVLLPFETLIGVAVFLAVAFVTRYISLGSVLGSLTLAGVMIYERFLGDNPPPPGYTWICVALYLLILYSHRQNIRRIIFGAESKFSLHAKPGKTNTEKANAK